MDRPAIQIILAALILAAACDDASGFEAQTACTPGETQECMCSGTEVGEQTCLEAGDAWSECDCGSGGDSDSDSDSDSDGDTDTDTDTDTDSDTDADTDTDTSCSEIPTAIFPEHVRLVLLEDMSGSMASNWTFARAAIDAWLADYGSGHVDFGLDVFPDVYSTGSATGCEVSETIPFAPAPANEADIAAYVTATTTVPGGSTPLYCAMERYLDYTFAPGFPAPTMSNYLVVISDGPDNCGVDCDMTLAATPEELGELTAAIATDGIMVFAIGIGTSYDPDTVSAIAAAGGTNHPTHFPATTQLQLEDALATIANSVLPCDWSVSGAATADHDNFNLYLEGVVVPLNSPCEDDVGWYWIDDSHEAIRLCDMTCKAAINTMPDPDLEGTVGCPTVNALD